MAASLPPSDEARLHHLANVPVEQRRASEWNDWLAFGAVMMILVGALNAVQGLLALLDDGYFATATEELAVLSYNAWGAVLLLWGVLLLACGLALYREHSWARWPVIAAALANVVAQVAFLPSRPLLSLILIAIDLTVVFALTVHWEDARRGHRGAAPTP